MIQFIYKITLTMLFAFYCSEGYSQKILWEQSYGGVHAEYLLDAIPTADYGFILAGSPVSDKTGNKAQKNSGKIRRFG